MPRKKTQREKEQGLVEIKRKVGTAPNGKSIYKSFYGSSKAAAEQKFREYIAGVNEKALPSSSITFGEWAEKWIGTYKQGDVRAVTFYNTYNSPLNVHILPEFGERPLRDILPADVKAFYNSKTEYSFSMLSKLRLILNAIFNTAIDNRILDVNPAKNVKLPKSPQKTEKRAYTYEQARQVVEFAKGHPLGAAVLILLKTGMRRSELLALRWQDVDLDAQIIHVRVSLSESSSGLAIEPCKTPQSIRDIPFDDELETVLKALRTLQKVVSTTPLVIPNAKGGVFSPRNWATRNYARFMADLEEACPGVPALLPHELRHSFGSILYEKKVDIVTISKLMGHSSIDVTVRLYVHDSFELMREAIAIGV